MPARRKRLTGPVAALLIGVAAGAPAQAEPAQATKAPTTRRAPARRPAGKRPPSTGPIATFPGFVVLEDGTSRVFVELTGSVPVELQATPKLVTLRLAGARVVARNNRNALVTTHFRSPVERARLLPTKDGLDLVIDLRADAKPTYRVLTGEGGRATLQVDFPALPETSEEKPDDASPPPAAPKPPAGENGAAAPKP